MMLTFIRFLPALVVGMSTTVMAESTMLVPTEVSVFIEPGTNAISVKAGHLLGTDKKDYLLVLDRDGDRELLILGRQNDGTLKVMAKNSHVIACEGCGGMEGGFSIAIHRGYFEVKNESGSASGGSQTFFRFEYSKKLKSWFFTKSHTIAAYAKINAPPGVNDYERKTEEIVPPKAIPFEKFAGEDFGMGSI